MIVISLDGNIGAGKTTLLNALRLAMPDVEVVLEPVGEWLALKGADGRSLLELFYEDKQRWAYTFQNCAILTRLRTLQTALTSTKKRVVITERSVLTDRFVFAEMLRASGDINEIEWQLYMQWYDTFATGLPMSGIIYITTDVATSASRIVGRAREGETIPMDYLEALEHQHEKWLVTTELPVIRVSTDSMDNAIAEIGNFVGALQKKLDL
jgi:deoxycitidine kinase/deoxyguanosine kinase